MDFWIAFIGFIPLKWYIPCKHMAMGHSFEFFFVKNGFQTPRHQLTIVHCFVLFFG